MAVENLMQFSGKQTPEIARENGRKGGLASGVSKRKKKLLREVIDEVLPMGVCDEDMEAALTEMGLEPSHETAIILAAVRKAEHGDIEAARFLRDTAGQNPTNKMDLYAEARPISSYDFSQLSDEELRQLAARCQDYPEDFEE